MDWLDNYNNILNDEKIQNLDLSLPLHNALYFIYLLSPMIKFMIDDNEPISYVKTLSIEKDIGIGMISITPNELQYNLEFNILNDISNEMIDYKKNHENLKNEIYSDFNKITHPTPPLQTSRNIGPPPLHKRSLLKTSSEISSRTTCIDNYINKNDFDELVKKYFPEWKKKELIHESIDRCDFNHIFYNYYQKEYDENILKYVKLIDEIKKFSKNFKNILKNIKIYLECKDM